MVYAEKPLHEDLRNTYLAKVALVGFQGRGCADGVQPDLSYALLPEALIFQWA